METSKLTIRLPKEDIQFVKQFASEHKISVTELIRRHLAHLRESSKTPIHPALQRITGILPQDIKTDRPQDDYHHYLLNKHQ